MSQAKVLSAHELRRVLDYTASRRHSARNRAMLLLTHYAGIYMLHSILEATGHYQKSARIVINFNRDLKKDIRAYQTIALSYGNIMGFLLHRKRDQDKLDKFHTVFNRLENIKEFRNSLGFFDITQFVKALSPAIKMDIFSKNAQMVNSMDEWINAVRVESYRKFLSSFAI
ncbi:MAG: hypothetical protein ACOYB0_05500 [Polynucleobacter sp.]